MTIVELLRNYCATIASLSATPFLYPTQIPLSEHLLLAKDPQTIQTWPSVQLQQSCHLIFGEAEIRKTPFSRGHFKTEMPVAQCMRWLSLGHCRTMSCRGSQTIAATPSPIPQQKPLSHFKDSAREEYCKFEGDLWGIML